MGMHNNYAPWLSEDRIVQEMRATFSFLEIRLVGSACVTHPTDYGEVKGTTGARRTRTRLASTVIRTHGKCRVPIDWEHNIILWATPALHSWAGPAFLQTHRQAGLHYSRPQQQHGCMCTTASISCAGRAPVEGGRRGGGTGPRGVCARGMPWMQQRGAVSSDGDGDGRWPLCCILSPTPKVPIQAAAGHVDLRLQIGRRGSEQPHRAGYGLPWVYIGGSCCRRPLVVLGCCAGLATPVLLISAIVCCCQCRWQRLEGPEASVRSGRRPPDTRGDKPNSASHCPDVPPFALHSPESQLRPVLHTPFPFPSSSSFSNPWGQKKKGEQWSEGAGRSNGTPRPICCLLPQFQLASCMGQPWHH